MRDGRSSVGRGRTSDDAGNQRVALLVERPGIQEGLHRGGVENHRGDALAPRKRRAAVVRVVADLGECALQEHHVLGDRTL